MNNLLRTLTESQIKPTGDLRLLLTTVKEGRKNQDARLTDPFYDSLEGLLTDLKTITIDNRDAEAFLKPVSRAEVPDYYDVIQHPMDFQTMLKKVKQKQYKSKREFKDDLDLIWSNCLTYNAAENHPLRPCVFRLREKAEKLLKHITDRKERADPPIPSDLPSSSLAGGIRRINGTSSSALSSSLSTTNGYLNGRSHTHSRSSSSLSQGPGQGHGSGQGQGQQSKSVTPKASSVLSGAGVGAGVGVAAGKGGKDVPFGDTPAIVRTPEGMALFREWDDEVAALLDVDFDVGNMDVDVVKLEEGSEGKALGVGQEVKMGAGAGDKERRDKLVESLRELAPVVVLEDEDAEDAMVVDSGPSSSGAVAGDKRKLTLPPSPRPIKKQRLASLYPTPLLDTHTKDELTQLWWGAVQSDALLGNGLPGIPFGPSCSQPLKAKRRRGVDNRTSNSASTSASTAMSIPTTSTSASSSASVTAPVTPVKRKPKKSIKHEDPSSPPQPPQNPKSLLVMMNNNIKTMRRLRHTHAKFAALNAAAAPPEVDEEGVGAGGEGAGGGVGPFGGGGAGAGQGGLNATPLKHTASVSFVDVEEEVNDKIDEAPWSVNRGRSLGKTKGKGRGKASEKGKQREKEKERVRGGIELGVESAQDCLHWTTNKVLEHSGFQGASSVAMDVLADVAAEYLQNVGRTIKYLSDQFGKTMTPEEIILHTLFESGSSKIQDLERYISDDIERYGARLGEVEKKLVSAYRETTATEVVDDEGLFDEDPEEVGSLAMGDFADMLGEDYLGLRELGIAAEFGLSNLSIPKKLLRGKKGVNRPAAAKPTEPPPPYPPPPPFVPLTADKVDDQIGLLKGYYQGRFTQLAVEKAPPAAGAPGAAIPGGVPAGPQVPGAMPLLAGPGMPATQAPGQPVPGLVPWYGMYPPNSLPSMGPPSGFPASYPYPYLVQPQVQTKPEPSMTSTPAPGATPAPEAQTQKALEVLSIPPDLALPDEFPDSTHMKIGPLGQVLMNKTGGGGGVGKKKKDTAAAGGGGGGGGGGGAGGGSGATTSGTGTGGGHGGGGGGGLPPGLVLANASAGAAAAAVGAASPTAKKKKGAIGVGSGNGRKKKDGGTGGAPPGPGMSGYGGQQSGLPAVVFASA